MKRFIEPLEIMKQHAAADRLRQGAWIWDKDGEGLFRGCFFGCAAQSNIKPIEKVCAEWDMPLWLGHLSEKIFERLPQEDARVWPVQLLTKLVNLPEDFDLGKVKNLVAIDRLTGLSESNPELSTAINGVIECHKEALSGGKPDWSAAWSVAQLTAPESESAAAWSAVESAIWSVSDSVSYSVAESIAAESAESAARSAAESAARSASQEAWREAWRFERDTLLKHVSVDRLLTSYAPQRPAER